TIDADAGQRQAIKFIQPPGMSGRAAGGRPINERERWLLGRRIKRVDAHGDIALVVPGFGPGKWTRLREADAEIVRAGTAKGAAGLRVDIHVRAGNGGVRKCAGRSAA